MTIEDYTISTCDQIYIISVLKTHLDIYSPVANLVWTYYLFRLPQPPLTCWQSRKVSLVSECLGAHPLHWGIQLGTGSTIVIVTAVTVWMYIHIILTNLGK